MTDRRVTGVETEVASRATSGNNRQVTGVETELATRDLGGQRRVTAVETELATRDLGGQRQVTFICVEVATPRNFTPVGNYVNPAGGSTTSIVQWMHTDGTWHDLAPVG